jgi:CBS domain-containing membrane protein
MPPPEFVDRADPLQSNFGQRVRAWAWTLWPAPVRVDGRERWRAFAGAAFGILVAGVLSRWFAGAEGLGPWLIAPMGASAVLVFAVPASPLAQPWAVVGGNAISALIGSACVLLIGDPAVAGAMAVALAIAAMFQLRCLHPPGGATALLMVLTHTGSFGHSVFPVLANSVLLVLAGMLYNSATGRPYPHTQLTPPQPGPADRSRFSAADLDAALAHYNQVLDVSRDDLEKLLHYAEMEAYRRNLGDVRCADIMSRDPVSVQFGTPLTQAWALLQKHRIKALPVTDRVRRIVGIVTVADFMRSIDLDQHHGIAARLLALLRPSGVTHTERPEVVGQIMTRRVQVASADRYLIELVPLFSEGGHHHIPIIDEEKRLVGVITQTDLVRALYRAARPDS